MKRGLTGHFVPLPSAAGEIARAFIPNPLPPAPPLELDAELHELVEKAMLALGRLDGLPTVLPDPHIFLYAYIRKEAVLSSQIEGTQSSLSDLLLFEMEGVASVPLDDVQEVSNYVAALNHGLKRLEALPLSLRLLKEIHGVLLAKGRGSKKEPGEFRRSQNWVGGTRPGNAVFVPPPPDQVLECFGALEKFLHNDPVKTPLLIKAALAHVQFETIHPFLDGNGRLGRLLITFLFCAEGALREPFTATTVASLPASTSRPATGCGKGEPVRQRPGVAPGKRRPAARYRRGWTSPSGARRCQGVRRSGFVQGARRQDMEPLRGCRRQALRPQLAGGGGVSIVHSQIPVNCPRAFCPCPRPVVAREFQRFPEASRPRKWAQPIGQLHRTLT